MRKKGVSRVGILVRVIEEQKAQCKHVGEGEVI